MIAFAAVVPLIAGTPGSAVQAVGSACVDAADASARGPSRPFFTCEVSAGASRVLGGKAADGAAYPEWSRLMIILGIICLVIGFIVSIPVLWTIGIILVVIGVIFWILGAMGHAIGGRKVWY